MLYRKIISPGIRLKNNAINCAYSSSVYKEQKVKIDKWDINYLKVGRGPHNVLFLPGALGTIWTDFKPQIEGFDKDKFTLVVWDPPGYGKSRPPNKEFTADFYEKDADYAFEFMKALKIPKYSLLGWSDGGVTGLIHAAKYSDAVIKLVAFATHSFLFPHEIDLYKKFQDVSIWSAKMRKPFEEVYGIEFLTQYSAQWINSIATTVFNRDNGNLCSHLLKDIKCPTLILFGEKDPVIDPSHTSYLIKHIAGSRLHLFPRGSHNIHINYADDFNKTVQEFLQLPS